jgi:hypothetical protein
MFVKVIACEIAFREICQAAARSPSVVDLEFLPQGYHDTPAVGRGELQQRIDAAPAGKYDAILLGYGLCSNILAGLTARHTRLVIPRAHDCIALFLGSKERYQRMFKARPGTYYYTSGWLEYRVRREGQSPPGIGAFLPAHSAAAFQATYQQWVGKYGQEKARYLAEVMNQWTANYTHGVLIEFDFAKPLRLGRQVREICAQRGWQFATVKGDLRLLQRWLAGGWEAGGFLIVPPGRRVVPTYNDDVIGLEAPK